MSRKYSVNDAEKIILTHERILSDLIRAASLPDKCREELKLNIDKVASIQANETLDKYPIEDLSSKAQPQALMQAGFKTIGDVRKAKPRDILSVYGVGPKTYEHIQKELDSLLLKEKAKTKIKLNYDNQTKDTTALLRSLSKLMVFRYTAPAARKLLEKHEKEIRIAINNSLLARSTIKYFFSAKKNKEKAENNLSYLQELLHSEYEAKAKNIFDKNDIAIKKNSRYIWDDFLKSPISYNMLLEEFLLEEEAVKNDDELNNHNKNFPNEWERNNSQQRNLANKNAVSPGIESSLEFDKYELHKSLSDNVMNQHYSIDGLKCQLRPYQAIGLKYILCQENVILGDEMGLGKTIQAIAAMVALRNIGEKYFLVVCPAAVLINWEREIQTKSGLKTFVIHKTGERRIITRKWIEEGGVAITTYAMLGNLEYPNEFKISLFVIDEAHYIKNPSALRTNNSLRLMNISLRVLMLTGTPIENKTKEFVQLISYIRPDVAAAAARFDIKRRPIDFRRVISPVYYRRKRETVLSELPELIEQNIWVELNEKEEMIYENYILDTGNKSYHAARIVSFHVDEIADSAKAQAIKEIIEQSEREGRKNSNFFSVSQNIIKN